jgi:outer membrane protein TolC
MNRANEVSTGMNELMDGIYDAMDELMDGIYDGMDEMMDSTLNGIDEMMDTFFDEFSPVFAGMGLPTPTMDEAEHSPITRKPLERDPVKELTEDDHWRMAGNVGISWNFNAAMILSIKSAHQNYEAGLITWEQTLKQTERDVRKLFYGMLLAQESLRLSEASLENAKGRADQAQTNYRNGRVSELSLLQAQVAYENQKPQVLKARQALENNLDTFAFLLGIEVGTKIQLEGSIAPVYYELDVDQLIQKNLNSRLDLQALSKNIEVLKTNKTAINLSSYTPSLALSWGWQPSATIAALKDKEIEWKDKWTDSGGLSITLAWNLTNMLPWSTQRQQAKDLDANIAKLRLTTTMLADQAKNEITALVKSLELSRTQIEAMQRTMNLAQRAYDLTMTSYRNGTTELLDVRDAENSLNQAKLGLLSEEFNYLSNVLDLEYAVNTKLGK